MKKEKAEVLENRCLPLLIEGWTLWTREKYREAYARINDTVVLIAADSIPETNIEIITERLLRNIKNK